MTPMRERIAKEIFDKILDVIEDGREPADICFEAADAVLAELERQIVPGAVYEARAMRERLIYAVEREANRYIREIGDNADWSDVPYEIFVDAMLAELERPSEEMMDAMHSVLFETTCPAGHEMQRSAFTAAIRAAKQG